MPYSIRQVGNKFAVIQTDSGKVVGTHSSKKKAQAQLGALYANVPDAKMDKMILTGGEGFSIEYNTPDCQDGYCITKNGTGQSIGCWKTKAEAEEALKGLVGESTNLLGDEVRTTKTPEEYAESHMNKCMTCGCDDPGNDHHHIPDLNKSIWDGVFVPASRGNFDPDLHSQFQDARYYFPSASPRDTDGQPKAGYGNRSDNNHTPKGNTGFNTADRNK